MSTSIPEKPCPVCKSHEVDQVTGAFFLTAQDLINFKNRGEFHGTKIDIGICKKCGVFYKTND